LAPRNGRSSARSLQDSVDQLAGAFDRLAARLEAIEPGGGAAAGETDKLTRHVRRYMPFYALATVWALMLIILPTRQDNGGATNQASSLTPGGAAQTFEDAGTGAPVDLGDSTTAAAGSSVRRSGVGPSTSAASAGDVGTTVVPSGNADVVDAIAWNKTGKTRGGFDCAKGVRQLPWSRYAAPCYPAWSGNNGGATDNGVTAKEIVIVDRDFPDSASSAAVDAFVQQAGFASSDEFEETQHKFYGWMNKVFELWGRKVKLVEYESEYGNSTDESLSKGKEGACADADSIKAKYNPFLILSGSSPFGECAAERKMTVLGAGAYYPDTWYRKYHPYIWAGVMECERIAHMNAEYLGKRIVNRPAKWSKDLTLDKSKRVMGIYVPNNDQYQFCVKMAAKELKDNYNAEFKSTYNYQLDITRFADEAARAIVQFAADRVTTIFLACDPLSPIFLTQSARGQEYFPEWVINSAGLTDVEQFARLWDQEEIQWSLWGMSQLGDISRILGPTGEGTTAYKKAFGTDIPPGTQTTYYAALGIFSVLQATGPSLTQENLAATYWRLPGGGAPEYEVGYTSYLTDSFGKPGHDHTAVDDMREVYWLCTQFAGDSEGSRCSAPKGSDGIGGLYVPTYNGKRFRPGEWPVGEAPVFKEKP
jgi:hypothetical protein